MLKQLGVTPFINAAGTYTRLGSPRLAPSTTAAMNEVAGAYLDLGELAAAVNARVARLLGVEAALVTAGAAAGIYLAVLACLAQGQVALAEAQLEGGTDAVPCRRVLYFGGQRNAYDVLVRVAGGELVEIDMPTTSADGVRAAFGEGGAAVLFMAGSHYAAGAPPLDAVIEAAHGAAIPVIVDAAAQLPPAANLTAYLRAGADLVLFSGGKNLRAPGGSGLLLGRPDLVAVATWQSTPANRLGRAMKVTKEDLAGMLAALEAFVAADEGAERARCEEAVTAWAAGLANLTSLRTERELPGEAGKPLPRLRVELASLFPADAEQVAGQLRRRQPPIAVFVDGPRRFYLNPETVADHEVPLVLAGVLRTIKELSA